MNKKLKIMSSVLCGVLIASNLGVTSVYAKTIKNDSPNRISETVKGETEFEAKIYQEKDGKAIELTDEDLAKMNLKINRKTLEIRKIRQKRDIDEGSRFEFYQHLSTGQINQLYAEIGSGGATVDAIVYCLRKIPGIGNVAALATFLSAIGICALQSADRGHGVDVYRLNTNYQIFTLVPGK